MRPGFFVLFFSPLRDLFFPKHSSGRVSCLRFRLSCRFIFFFSARFIPLFFFMRLAPFVVHFWRSNMAVVPSPIFLHPIFSSKPHQRVCPALSTGFIFAPIFVIDFFFGCLLSFRDLKIFFHDPVGPDPCKKCFPPVPNFAISTLRPPLLLLATAPPLISPTTLFWTAAEGPEAHHPSSSLLFGRCKICHLIVFFLPHACQTSAPCGCPFLTQASFSRGNFHFSPTTVDMLFPLPSLF